MNKHHTRVTRRNIINAIKERVGVNVGIHGNQTIGCYNFYSDDKKTGDILSGKYTSSVDVNNLSDLPIDRWVDEFIDIWES